MKNIYTIIITRSNTKFTTGASVAKWLYDNGFRSKPNIYVVSLCNDANATPGQNQYKPAIWAPNSTTICIDNGTSEHAYEVDAVFDTVVEI